MVEAKITFQIYFTFQFLKASLFVVLIQKNSDDKFISLKNPSKKFFDGGIINISFLIPEMVLFFLAMSKTRRCLFAKCQKMDGDDD